MAAPNIRVLTTGSSEAGFPVSIGTPFPEGIVREAKEISVRNPSGDPVPSDAHPLAQWPDGSIRWALVGLLAKEPGVYPIELGQSTPFDKGVVLREMGERIALSNGLVKVVLARKGASPIETLEACGYSYLAASGDFSLRVDGADTRREPDRTFRILQNSSVRATVRVEGGHYTADGSRRLSYRLDVELWAGWPALRLDYQFFHLEPGCPELEIEEIALEFNLALGAETERRFLQSVQGVNYIPREVLNSGPVALVTDDTQVRAHVEDPAMLLDPVEYPPHLHPPLTRTADWLGIRHGGRSLFACMRDFAAMRPKRLVSEGNRLALEVWPKRAGVLRLPQGRSRRQTLTLAFFDQASPSRASIESALSAPLSEGRACVDREWLRECREFELERVLVFGRNVRFEKYLRKLMVIETPQTMFDLGDTCDTNYLRHYTALADRQLPIEGAPQLPRVFLSNGHLAPVSRPDYYEPVWTNNEYDLLHAFCCEIMRTGQNRYWTVARWVARHNIEVDFQHYQDDRWQHRATPAHSARHTTSGSYPSHFWTQGLLEYYCLTGDVDALEVATALGEKIIENFADSDRRAALWGFNREIGWPVLALSHLADITQEARFQKQLDELVEYLIQYDYRAGSRSVSLSNVDPSQSFLRQVVSAFFGYASMIEGLDHFARRKSCKKLDLWLAEFLRDFANALRAAHLDGEPMDFTFMQTQGLAIGFRRSGDPEFLKLGLICLREFMESEAWSRPPVEGKPVAMLHRALVHFLGEAEADGMLGRLDYPEVRG